MINQSVPKKPHGFTPIAAGPTSRALQATRTRNINKPTTRVSMKTGSSWSTMLRKYAIGTIAAPTAQTTPCSKPAIERRSAYLSLMNHSMTPLATRNK